ncbi:TPA: O49 family O-antigen polymerase, partial [Escherichia coli]
MISEKKNMRMSSFKAPLIFCLLAAFLPLGSTIGVAFSWVIFPAIAIILTFLVSRFFYRSGVYFLVLSIVLLVLNYGIVLQYVSFAERLEFNMLLAIIGCFYMSVVFFSYKFNFSDLSKAINIVLLISIILFFIQFLSYYLFNYRIDYSLATGGIGTRNDYGSLYRASGIFNEPAEYSSAITVLVVSSYLINRKLSLLNIIALISTMLSFSFVGIIQSFFVIYIVLFRNLCRKPVYIFLIIGIVILVWISFFDLFIDRYEAFINGSDGSNNTKLDTLNFFLTHTEYLLGGAGLIGYDPETMPLFMQGLYDLTFFGSCISIFGIVIGSFIAIAVTVYIIYNYTISDMTLIFICLLKIN